MELRKSENWVGPDSGFDMINCRKLGYFIILSPMIHMDWSLHLHILFVAKGYGYSHLLVYLDKSVSDIATIMKHISGRLIIVFMNVLTPPLFLMDVFVNASCASTSAVVAMRFRHVKPRNHALRRQKCPTLTKENFPQT